MSFCETFQWRVDPFCMAKSLKHLMYSQKGENAVLVCMRLLVVEDAVFALMILNII